MNFMDFHHIDSSHPRFIMSYHWYVECEIMCVLQGTLTVTLDESFSQSRRCNFCQQGVLHSGIPQIVSISAFFR